MYRYNLLAYPNFNEELKIHTNASTFQLGSDTSQKGKPTAFYGKKLTFAQKGCTVTEKYLLSILETVK